MRSRVCFVFGAAAAFMLVMPATSAAQRAPYSRIVVFGTSLSDSGNAFALRGGTNTPPDYRVDPLLIPGVPYARGGHHFSNGATWVEQLARALGLAGTVRPAFGSGSLNHTNYAVGAARARDDGQNFNLTDQVSAFLSAYAGVAPSDALYVIEMGGNDLRDAIAAYVGTLQATGSEQLAMQAAGAILTHAIQAIAANIQALYVAGARNFLVWLPPDPGLTPALRTLAQVNPAISFLAQQLTAGFHQGLSAVLAQLDGLPGIDITRFNSNELLIDVVEAPGVFGLTNVTGACLMPSVPPFFCQAADEYLFWDGIHPTRAGHAIVAQRVAALLMQ